MVDEQKKTKKRHKRGEAVEVICPKCNLTEIIYIPEEQMPKCPNCNVAMIIREILVEGKSC